jgi:hypothetical protein
MAEETAITSSVGDRGQVQIIAYGKEDRRVVEEADEDCGGNAGNGRGYKIGCEGSWTRVRLIAG